MYKDTHTAEEMQAQQTAPSSGRRGSSSSCESSIREAIQRVQGDLTQFDHQLSVKERAVAARTRGGGAGAGAGGGAGLAAIDTQGLHETLRGIHSVVQHTEDTFRTWTVELAGEVSADKQRLKFAFEKLSKHFQAEIGRLRQLAKRLVELEEVIRLRASAHRKRAAAASKKDTTTTTTSAADEEQETLLKPSSTDTGTSGRASQPRQMETRRQHPSPTAPSPHFDEEMGPPEGDDFDQDDGDDQDDLVLAHDSSVKRSIAEERLRGIQRIQSQVGEVNEIFRDLAVMVEEQGQFVTTIESSMESTLDHTGRGVEELKRASDLQRSSRERGCFLLMVVVLCLFVLSVVWRADGGSTTNTVGGGSGHNF
ncbi:unnamed protein product [Vitrella brassicaformis CCMP3155]|uniref:t-SNARE coiled-coil homology domain-containing protein n=1 Tax=Vitrella brassicaformis (strain CCMP3155) TaxID=1169540 RepID=A0A0G4GHK7_VITBC|nr:unnamed protein product [Vitrella brassicaformis CCMP3155]|eukprot:CEM29219.1 unnamed protein product [Vitrella brassicaformis CCMP3155]